MSSVPGPLFVKVASLWQDRAPMDQLLQRAGTARWTDLAEVRKRALELEDSRAADRVVIAHGEWVGLDVMRVADALAPVVELADGVGLVPEALGDGVETLPSSVAEFAYASGRGSWLWIRGQWIGGGGHEGVESELRLLLSTGELLSCVVADACTTSSIAVAIRARDPVFWATAVERALSVLTRWDQSST